MREAKGEIPDRYRGMLGHLVVATVVSTEGEEVVVDLDDVRGVLPLREQVPGEHLRAGERIMAYVIDINGRGDGAVVGSRSHKGVVEKLLEMEVPEIYGGIVRIEASAREPGVHSKIAVSAVAPDVDPVQACLGTNAARLKAVIHELCGEKID